MTGIANSRQRQLRIMDKMGLKKEASIRRTSIFDFEILNRNLPRYRPGSSRQLGDLDRLHNTAFQ